MLVVLDDITKLDTEAIVNAANKTLLGGGGVDGAIHRAAGGELKEYCAGLGGCNVGMAKISPGFNLPCKYVIHTVAPIWGKCTPEAADAYLASCYASCMALARENNIKSIAFPCIGTGIYGFPFSRACRIAIGVLQCYKDIDIVLVTFTAREFDEYCSIMSSLCHICGDTAEEDCDGMVSQCYTCNYNTCMDCKRQCGCGYICTSCKSDHQCVETEDSSPDPAHLISHINT